MKRLIVAMMCLAVVATASQELDYAVRDEGVQLADELVDEYGFDRKDVVSVLRNATYRPRIIELMTRPAERKPWLQYRDIFLTETRTAKGVEFLTSNADVLNRAYEHYGVPPHIVTAIIGVETNYGGNMGTYRVIDALSTLGFDYPRRAAFFREQLKTFFVLACEERIIPFDKNTSCRRESGALASGDGRMINELVGSYAGAMGYGQFIPSSYRSFAIDFDGDGIRDIWGNTEDAIGSVANYFAEHGWRNDALVLEAVELDLTNDALVTMANEELRPNRTIGEWKQLGVRSAANEESMAALFGFETEGGIEYLLGFNDFYVITRYNHSRLYARAVYLLAEDIRSRL